MSRVKVLKVENDRKSFQYGSYCVLMYYASQIDNAKSEKMFNTTCTEYQVRYNYGLSTDNIDEDDATAHFDILEINEVISFIDHQLIPALEVETEDLVVKYGGLNKFVDVFCEQTNFLMRMGIDVDEYFDFDPRSIIFDLIKLKTILSRAIYLNKAHVVYFD